MIQDALGDRLKEIEQTEAGRRAVKGMPIMARLDGRAFHTFTKGLARPYDERMSTLMVDTTKFLVEQTHALVGYTQSDEISLCWFEDEDSLGTYLFDGKLQKLTSVLASLATSYFVKHLDRLPEKSHTYPTFDCRVWQVESMQDAYLNFLWRQDDAVKNAISMAAQAHFSARKLHGVGGEEKKKMLEEIGHPFDAHPQFFKSGTFVQRVVKDVMLSEEDLARIPEAHRPTGPVKRSFVEDIKLGPLREVLNPKFVLFNYVEKERSFMEQCLRGDAVAEDVDIFVELWHNSEAGHGQTLSEYLGFNRAEYSRWVLNSDSLPEILQERLASDRHVMELAEELLTQLEGIKHA